MKKWCIRCGILICCTIPILIRWESLDSKQRYIMSAVSPYLHERVTMTGMIDEEPVIQGAAQDFTVHLKTITTAHTDSVQLLINTRIRVSAKLYPRYSYGDEISFTGTLALPRNFGDEGGSSDGREFDYVHYLSKDGVFYITKNPSIVVIASGHGNFLVATLLKIKQAFLKNIYSALGEPNAALAAGLVVGEKTGLGKDLLDDFRRSGLIHIVILSGYSVNIIANSIRAMLSFLPRSMSLISGGVAIFLFGILVGGKATVIRACAMALIAIFAQFFYKDYSAFRALLFTAYVMVVVNPYIVPYDASFQVSFTATLGLILLGRHLDRWLHFIPERFGIRGMIISTLATQIAVFPLLLYMMGDGSLIGVFANLLVLPFIPVMMLAVFCTGFFGFISIYLSYCAAGFSYIFLSYTLFIVRVTSHIPYTLITVRKFPLALMACTYLVYAMIYFYIRYRERRQKREPLPISLELSRSSSRSPPS